MSEEKKVIQELTKEQEAAMPSYVEKWTKIGLDTTTNRAEAEKAIDLVYKCGGLTPPERKVWAKSPMEGVRIASELSGLSMSDCLSAACYGSQDASWFSFYDFMKTEVKVDIGNELDGLFEMSKHAGWFFPFDELVVLTDKPTEIHIKNGRAHKDLGPAIGYGDGEGIYMLNGVRCPKDIVMTPADELDAKLVITETNAEIRSEIVKKIGINRVFKALGHTVLDTKTCKSFAEDVYHNTLASLGLTDVLDIPQPKEITYELVSLSLGDGRTRPFLKMNNPSIDDVHVEGVHPDCRTVDQALAYRNGEKNFMKVKFTPPTVLT